MASATSTANAPVGLSKTSAAISTAASTLGGGILFMATGFNMMGYAIALGALAFISLITAFSLYALGYAALRTEQKRAGSYPLLAAAFSRWLKQSVDAALFGSSFGTMFVLSRLLVETMSRELVRQWPEMSASLAHFGSLTAAIAALTLAFVHASVGTLTLLGRISMATVVFYGAVMCYYGVAFGQKMSDLDWMNKNVGGGFARFVMALHCQFSFLSIFASMQEISAEGLRTVCTWTGVLLFLIYGCTGFFAYKFVGRAIGDKNILAVLGDPTSALMERVRKESFDKYGVLPRALSVTFLAVFFGAVVFSALPVMEILQGALGQRKRPLGRPAVAAMLGGALFLLGIPKELDFGRIMTLISALFTNPLSFLFPPVFLVLVTPRRSVQRVAAQLLALFSVMVMIGMAVEVMWR